MPSVYRVAVKSHFLYARHYGPQSLAGQRRAYEAYLADPNYHLGRPEFIDLSGLIVKRISFDRTRSFASLVNRQFKDGARGTLTVIWAPEESVFAAARMFQLSAEATAGPSIEAYVIRDEAEAFETLGVPERRVADFIAAHDFGPTKSFPDL